ncbi:MAG TPA: histidine kinase [Streptosporangiaceae bacterium]
MHALYAWPRRHPRLMDGVLAVFLLGIGAGLGARRATWPVFGLLAALMAIPVVFRRRHPALMFVVAAGAGALQILVASRPIFADLALLVLLYTVAAYRPRRTSLPALAVCFAGALAAITRWAPPRVFHYPSLITEVIIYFTVPVALAWVLGDSMQYRRGYLQALEERAVRLERERDAQAQVAAAAERARIAREMHDVIAHHVSVMVVQADGAAFALDAEPDQARAALGAISRTGRQALTEMRRLLGVLRTGDQPAALTPQPGMSQLGELLGQARVAGLPVTCTVQGVPRELSGSADLAAYRVVQESLTNTRKHGGPGASADVALRYEPDGLVLIITDDGRGAAATGAPGGHGLAGMRERVEIYGGTVRAGPRAGGGYQVAVTVPFAGPAVTA